MIYASTPVSRHHNYVCQLIQKMELRFGSHDEILNPLRVEAARFDEDAPAYWPVRTTHHAEPSVSVVQRLWGSRLQKMHRAQRAAVNTQR